MSEKQTDEKELGKVALNETSEIIVRRTVWKGETRLDIRTFVNSEEYTGWTKRGIAMPKKVFDELLAILKGVDENW